MIVTFIVQKDGSVTHAKIAKSIDPELDAEALRVVKGMPKWTPGTQNGKPVSVRYMVPVKFSLWKDATPGKKKYSRISISGYNKSIYLNSMKKSINLISAIGYVFSIDM